MRIGIDLMGCNSTYSGGVATFAVGLAKGFARAKSPNDSIVILSTIENDLYLRSLFEETEATFLKVYPSKYYRIIISLLKYIGAIFKCFKIPFFFEKVFPANEVREIQGSVDCLVVPTTTLSYSALDIPTILCVHDIQQEYYPEFFSLRERLFRWTSYRLSCWAATAVQASSHFIKECLLQKFEFMQEKKIFISYEGVDFERFSVEQKTSKPDAKIELTTSEFIFYPAQIWQHKNHRLLIDALIRFRADFGYELVCVLTGQDGGYWSFVEDQIKQASLKKVVYLGRVDFEQLLWLYQNCKAVLALGLHESSSLPVREGAVFGRPLICSRIPPNVEVGRILNISLVDCRESDELFKALTDLSLNKDVSSVDIAHNIERVHVFKWEVLVKDYLRVIDDWR